MKRKQTLEEIYSEHMQDLFRYLLSLTGDSHYAEDLMQETFYRMLVHIDYYKGEEIREVPSLALEATIPNSRVMGGGTSVEAFFRTNSQFDLVRTVGKKEMPLGTIENRVGD